MSNFHRRLSFGGISPSKFVQKHSVGGISPSKFVQKHLVGGISPKKFVQKHSVGGISPKKRLRQPSAGAYGQKRRRRKRKRSFGGRGKTVNEKRRPGTRRRATYMYPANLAGIPDAPGRGQTPLNFATVTPKGESHTIVLFTSKTREELSHEEVTYAFTVPPAFAGLYEGLRIENDLWLSLRRLCYFFGF